MFLRELTEANARRIVAIMPGGFHPFHPGHKSLYDWAVKTFGQQNVYVAATNDTATRPFPFEVKKQLASMAGVPSNKFIQVKSPFNVNSYKELLDGDTALVFVRSVKDKAEQPLPDQTKKDGNPGYLKTYTGKNLETYDVSGYMAYGPTINFNFSGMQIKSASELRTAWPNMSPEDKLTAAKLMYGNGAPAAVRLLDQALSTESVEEDRHHNERPQPGSKPTMPAGTVRVDVSDVYDWYKLGQHISDLEGLGKHDFGQGPPSTIISFGSEEEEHKYLQLLKKTGLNTVDIDPVDPKQPKGIPRQKTDPTYNVENFEDGKNPERKGLAKRVGVNTKASVGSLRKTAKSSSGEKQRMAHWLANMKAGRAKKQ